MTYRAGNIVRLLPLEKYDHLSPFDHEVKIASVGTDGYTSTCGLTFLESEIRDLVADWD